MIAGSGIENEYPDSTRQTRQGTRQIAFFVASKDDGGD
jgi:hypothetical protein